MRREERGDGHMVERSRQNSTRISPRRRQSRWRARRQPRPPFSFEAAGNQLAINKKAYLTLAPESLHHFHHNTSEKN